jgi:hypothetical protein
MCNSHSIVKEAFCCIEEARIFLRLFTSVYVSMCISPRPSLPSRNEIRPTALTTGTISGKSTSWTPPTVCPHATSAIISVALNPCLAKLAVCVARSSSGRGTPDGPGPVASTRPARRGTMIIPLEQAAMATTAALANMSDMVDRLVWKSRMATWVSRKASPGFSGRSSRRGWRRRCPRFRHVRRPSPCRDTRFFCKSGGE